MFIELGLLLTLLAACAWLYASHRSKLKREVSAAVVQAICRDSAGLVIFDGAQAQVLLQDDEYSGSDQTGPCLRARCLCAMPAGGVFWVTVDSSQKGLPGFCVVEPMSPADADQVLIDHPHLMPELAHLQR
jgi:hypothetical protein